MKLLVHSCGPTAVEFCEEMLQIVHKDCSKRMQQRQKADADKKRDDAFRKYTSWRQALAGSAACVSRALVLQN